VISVRPFNDDANTAGRFTVTSSAPGLVTVNLASLDGRAPCASTFAGTDTSAAQDAVASACTVRVPVALPLTSAELLLSQATLQSATRDTLRIGPVTLNPASSGTGLQLVPDTSANSPPLGIAHTKSWSIDSFSTFSDLVTALTTDLNGTTDALLVYASGPYNASTGVLSADQILVLLNN
jgi:hypothetical protein